MDIELPSETPLHAVQDVLLVVYEEDYAQFRSFGHRCIPLSPVFADGTGSVRKPTTRRAVL